MQEGTDRKLVLNAVSRKSPQYADHCYKHGVCVIVLSFYPPDVYPGNKIPGHCSFGDAAV